MNYTFVIGCILYFVLLGIAMGLSVRRIEKIESGKIPTDYRRYVPFGGLIFAHLALPHLSSDLLLRISVNTHYLPLLIGICAYNCLILVLLPPLRKIVKAKTCGWLWLVPLCGVHLYAIMSTMVEEPLWVISLGKGLTEELGNILQQIWFCGAAGVFGYYLVSHVLFKRKLKKYAYAVTDREILRVWEREQYMARFPENYLQLRISSQAQTPLSIGLFRRTTYVILPEKTYTEEELALIFRHELIHIGRKDNVVKFYMLLMTALFWFNPLMWLAMRYSADDFELSCDETALLGCSLQTRKKYAELLLTTAANQRGFTTCLSASARALRYRMKHAMVNRKRSYGALMICAAIILFEMGTLFVDFTYLPGEAGKQIFTQQDPTDYTFGEAFITVEENDLTYSDAQSEELMKYLFALPVSRLMRKYSGMGVNGQHAQIRVATKDDIYSTIIWLSDNYLRVRSFPEGKPVETCYILHEPIDWNYLISLMQ